MKPGEELESPRGPGRAWQLGLGDSADHGKEGGNLEVVRGDAECFPGGHGWREKGQAADGPVVSALRRWLQ